MAFITPNLSEVQAPIEAGNYAVRITKVETGGKWEKEKNGETVVTDYVTVTFDTFDEEDPKNNGRKIFDRVPINGGGAFRFMNLVKAATGMSPEEMSEGLDTETLIGRELSMTVDINDKGYTEVKAVKAID